MCAALSVLRVALLCPFKVKTVGVSLTGTHVAAADRRGVVNTAWSADVD